QNSPLFQYLQDLGHTDFETCPAVSQEEGQCTGEEGPLLQDIPTTPRAGLFLKLANALLKWSPFQKGTMSDGPEQQLDVGFRQYSLHTILEQEVLLQEDVELIELLDPSILSTGTSPEAQSGSQPGLHFLAAPSVWDLSVLAAFTGVLVGHHFLTEGLSWVGLCPWLLALTAYLLLRGLSLWRTARLQRTMRSCSGRLEELTANSRAFTSLVRKALRLIQETEVISRGFTLVSAACPFNKAGQQRSQQLLGLRKAVYRSLRAAVRASRLATCHMLSTYPLNSEIDNVTNYVSTVPLKELGLGLSEERLSDEQAQELTDDYNLPALKVLFQLWVGQSSEFFRRMALLLSPVQKQEQPDSCLMHQAVSEVTEPLRRTLTGCLGDLRRSYDFHRYFETQHLPKGGPEQAGRVRQKCRELNSLYTAIRSLQLHLKALLNDSHDCTWGRRRRRLQSPPIHPPLSRLSFEQLEERGNPRRQYHLPPGTSSGHRGVIILEDELEKLMVSREPAEMTCAGYQDLQNKLQLIQPHMQASSSCWEEAVAQVDKMMRRATNCTGKNESPEKSEVPPIIPAAQPVAQIEDRDPVPEEQELEAYVEDSDSDGEHHGSLFDFLSPEDRERQKKEREESRRVLQELKSVLGLRASEAERQKWKQLLFSDQAVLKPAVPVGSSDLEGTSAPPLDTDSHERESGQDNHVAAGGRERQSAPSPSDTETEYCCGRAEREETQHGPVQEQRAPASERLAGLHGSSAVSFSSALAAQVAARSHAFSCMQEQTFGDEEEEGGEGEELGRPREDSEH
ncbi:VEZA protein, partial [Atractosteus spatula]|nr:VEZA protein [Atractosteus spatula]